MRVKKSKTEAKTKILKPKSPPKKDKSKYVVSFNKQALVCGCLEKIDGEFAKIGEAVIGMTVNLNLF